MVRRFVNTQDKYCNTCFHNVHLLFKQEVSRQRLLKAFDSLLRAHRSLTLNLSGDDHSLFYNPRHLRKEPVILSCAGEDVYRFNLYKDLLVRVILNGNSCEIVINHLVIDYVSWRILLQDLDYLLSGSEIQELPCETESYGEYASQLAAQLESSLFIRQRRSTNTLRKMYAYQRERLLQRARQRAEEKGQSLSQWLYQLFALCAVEFFGLKKLEIELEETGREQMDDRYRHTVGWFTAFSYVQYQQGCFSCTSESAQSLPVIRFNFLGRVAERYKMFSMVPLQEELLRFKNEDTLGYFLQADCLVASDACLSFCLSVDPDSPAGVASDHFMDSFFARLDARLDSDTAQGSPTYIDQGISAEDLAVLMGES